ncbi:lysine exporter LysO family protein [Acinetobacter sp. S40]|uniref:lysine exporter LysO family protein n=1 Tax=Acinetobacter sp. S40 TaxID=2767434 RepID=UPI00190B9EC7|nr:lysine exporter LysO family protein [Acinetobacter sp. S40]MBJ9985006.1 lysine exporter LysO family protein [Acinetobacter sp. S40]
MQSLVLIFQIFIAISLGYFIAPKLNLSVRQFIFKTLPYFSYLLLIGVAFEFAQALVHLEHPDRILPTALLIAFSTSITSFFVCLVAYKFLDKDSVQGNISLHLFLNALKNISYAFIALGFGAMLGFIVHHFQINVTFNSWYLLLIFIGFIGTELAYTHFDRSWVSWKILIVPVAAILGSLIAAIFCFALLTGYTLNEVIALSQGYGWYSMSGILFTKLHSTELGGIALLTDLFREIFAILLMYCLGWRFPRSAISSAGATSMDVTLAMVKQSCGTHYVPHAMMSGIILSLLAPLLISFFLMI